MDIIIENVTIKDFFTMVGVDFTEGHYTLCGYYGANWRALYDDLPKKLHGDDRHENLNDSMCASKGAAAQMIDDIARDSYKKKTISSVVYDVKVTWPAFKKTLTAQYRDFKIDEELMIQMMNVVEARIKVQAAQCREKKIFAHYSDNELLTACWRQLSACAEGRAELAELEEAEAKE